MKRKEKKENKRLCGTQISNWNFHQFLAAIDESIDRQSGA